MSNFSATRFKRSHQCHRIYFTLLQFDTPNRDPLHIDARLYCHHVSPADEWRADLDIDCLNCHRRLGG
jgi:hypothetical protein